MIHKKALVIAPYPIAEPRHGGQKRVRALVDFYKTVFREVRFVAIFPINTYSESDESITIDNSDTYEEIKKFPYAGDVIAGRALYEDIHARNELAHLLVAYKPDIVQIEQVFHYAGVQKLLNDLGMAPKLILSSQNIEHEMKQSIFKQLHIKGPEALGIIAETQSLEKEFSKRAELVIAVSKEDQAAHLAMGARKCIVVPNGISRVAPSQRACVYWRRYRKTHDISHIFAFIGSGHPPNWAGFLQMIGEDTGFLDEGQRIIVAGGVSDYFQHAMKEKPDFWRRLELVGVLEEDMLAGLIRESDSILLPICSGGGSNLKTAEAILADKKIIATDFALRSFEQFTDFPNLYVANTKKDFKGQMLEAVKNPKKPRSKEQQKLAEALKWDSCLAPLEKELAVLAKTTARELVIVFARKVRNRLLWLLRYILH